MLVGSLAVDLPGSWTMMMHDLDSVSVGCHEDRDAEMKPKMLESKNGWQLGRRLVPRLAQSTPRRSFQSCT